jgi:hypothetical protein
MRNFILILTWIAICDKSICKKKKDQYNWLTTQMAMLTNKNLIYSLTLAN